MTKQQLRVVYRETNVALGSWGEKQACALLRRHDHTASIRTKTGYDIRARDKRTGCIRHIEVKTARKGKDGKWRFTLEKQGKYGHTSASHSDYVILLAVLPEQTVTFVIPVKDIAGKRAIVITSNPVTYKGRFASYRENWNILQ